MYLILLPPASIRIIDLPHQLPTLNHVFCGQDCSFTEPHARMETSATPHHKNQSLSCTVTPRRRAALAEGMHREPSTRKATPLKICPPASCGMVACTSWHPGTAEPVGRAAPELARMAALPGPMSAPQWPDATIAGPRCGNPRRRMASTEIRSTTTIPRAGGRLSALFGPPSPSLLSDDETRTPALPVAQPFGVRKRRVLSQESRCPSDAHRF